MQPKTNGSHPGRPGAFVVLLQQAERIIDAFTPKSATSAATSAMPVIRAISTIISDELNEYSIHRA